MDQLPDIKSLQVFAAFTDYMNMTAAAKALKMTQSAVSQQLNHLEDQLGVRLIDRDTRPLQLTHSGKILSCRAKKIIAEVDNTVMLVQHKTGLKFPHLTIGLAHSFADLCLPLFIQSMKKCVDKISSRSAISQDLVQGLREHNLDLIITSQMMSESTEFESFPIFVEPFIVIYPHKLKQQQPCLTQLSQQLPYVGVSASTNAGRQIESFLRVRSIGIVDKLEVHTFDEAIAMVDANLGWAVTTPLSVAIAAKKRDLGDCILDSLPEPGLTRTLTVLARKDELGMMPQKIARLAANLINKEFLSDIQKIAPFACAAIETFNYPAVFPAEG